MTSFADALASAMLPGSLVAATARPAASTNATEAPASEDDRIASLWRRVAAGNTEGMFDADGLPQDLPGARYIDTSQFAGGKQPNSQRYFTMADPAHPAPSTQGYWAVGNDGDTIINLEWTSPNHKPRASDAPGGDDTDNQVVGNLAQKVFGGYGLPSPYPTATNGEGAFDLTSSANQGMLGATWRGFAPVLAVIAPAIGGVMAAGATTAGEGAAAAGSAAGESAASSGLLSNPVISGAVKSAALNAGVQALATGKVDPGSLAVSAAGGAVGGWGQSMGMPSFASSLMSKGFTSWLGDSLQNTASGQANAAGNLGHGASFSSALNPKITNQNLTVDIASALRRT